MPVPKPALPIDSLISEIVLVVRDSPLTLIEAEPGAGKTTRVPPALLTAGLGHVYVLEPRRLAARLAAQRVAAEFDEPLGRSVGYRVRFEQVGSRESRLWYMTEGVLLRMLLGKTPPAEMGVVILDEFHERHLETDVVLALLRGWQERGSKVRLILMSATLGAEELGAKLEAPLIRAPGRVFPVELKYTASTAAPLEEQVRPALEKALAATSGHVLIFLPGAAEIRKALRACESVCRSAGARLLPLYADLSPAEQDAAVAPSTARKVICSTNVTESSVTIDGVTAIIDSGLARTLRHSAASGIHKLHIQRISRASAVQRAGRAGRTGPGLAIRLYSEEDFARRPEQLPPEILRADLSEMLLQLSAAGTRAEALRWLDPPAPEQIAVAELLLERLGAFASGTATKLGVRMAASPIHPRLSRFVSAAAERGAAGDASKIAALLSEGAFRIEDEARGRLSSDIEFLLAQELSFGARRVSQQLRQIASHRAPLVESHALEKAFLLAYPDRVARRRLETILLSNGHAARLRYSGRVRAEFFVAIDLEDREKGELPLITLAAEIEPDWLLEFFPERVRAKDELVWNRETERVEQISRLQYDDLAFEETRSRPAGADASAMLVQKVQEAGIESFLDGDELRRFLSRVQFSARHAGFELPADLVASACREMASGLVSFAEFRAVISGGAFFRKLEAQLPMPLIDRVAPTHIALPSGRRARIEYYEDRPPAVSSRLQDFFGMRQTPTVAGGAVPLTIHLLAPNQRPVQVTTDLVSFWQNLYPQLRKELSRRYPKHAWPEKVF